MDWMVSKKYQYIAPVQKGGLYEIYSKGTGHKPFGRVETVEFEQRFIMTAAVYLPRQVLEEIVDFLKLMETADIQDK